MEASRAFRDLGSRDPVRAVDREGRRLPQRHAVQGRDNGICSSQRSTPNPLASVKIRPINVPHAMRFEKSRPRASAGTMALIKECQAGPGAELINPWIKNQANTNVKRGGVERSAATKMGSHANRPRPAQTMTIRLR